MKLVFCGTPHFAVPTLEAVLGAGYNVAMVLTQPDRPSGRGMQLTASPVKQLALAAGIRVEQPGKIKTNESLRAQLELMAPDAILVVAYGRIIPPWMLALPRYGNINLHGSLLPKYRGAAPIQWAIARGESITGVTTMRLDEGLDTGDLLLRQELAIRLDQTAADMYPLLAQIGSRLMLETLSGLKAGTIAAEAQNHEQATLAPILTREDGRIDPARSAHEIYNRWRGFQPWPGAWSTLLGKKLTVTRLALAPSIEEVASPGVLLARTSRLFLACGDNAWIELVEVQIEGRRSMSAAEFLRGASLPEGTQLG